MKIVKRVSLINRRESLGAIPVDNPNGSPCAICKLNEHRGSRAPYPVLTGTHISVHFGHLYCDRHAKSAERARVLEEEYLRKQGYSDKRIARAAKERTCLSVQAMRLKLLPDSEG
jgi:hypothetical protein